MNYIEIINKSIFYHKSLIYSASQTLKNQTLKQLKHWLNLFKKITNSNFISKPFNKLIH